MKEFLQKKFIFFDTIKGLLLGVISIFFLTIFDLLKLDNIEFLTIAEIYFTLGGFLFSIFTLIFAFKDGKKLGRLQKSLQYKQVFEIFFNAIIWHMFFAVIFLILSYLKIPNIDIFLIVFYVSIPILSIKIYRCIRIIREIALLTINEK